MITYLRDRAQSWLIKVLLLLIVVTFIISFGIGTFSNPKEVLVRVGSQEILVREFSRQYEEELERMRQQFGENTEVIARQLNLRQQIYQQMVNQLLILKSAEEQGLVVTDAEVQASVVEQPAFRAGGGFDRSVYRNILQQNRLSPGEYEARLRQDLMVSKFRRNLLAGLVVTQAEVEQRYRVNHEKVRVDYIHVDPAKFRKGTKASAEEIQAYYEKHPEQFQQPVRLKVRYFVLSTKYYAQTAKVRERAIERYYERNLDTRFTKPPRVRASHILKEVPSGATPAEVQAQKTAAEKLRQQVLNGADFAKLAKAHSDGPSAKSGGDLGLFARGDMVPEFSDAAFALEPGGISAVVRTQFGFHVIRVTAVEPGSEQTLEQVRDEIRADLRIDRAARKLQLEADRIPQRIEKEGLDSVATALNVQLATTDWFDNTSVLPTLGSAGPLYQALLKAPVNRTGVHRRNPLQGHVFYELVDRQGAVTKTLTVVRSAVVGKVRDEKSIEAALAAAKSGLKSITTDAAFTEFARKHGLSTQKVEFSATERSIPTLGANRDFQRRAFRLDKSQRFGLSIQERKAYLLRFNERFMPQGKDAEKFKAKIAQKIEQEWGEYFISNEIERLKAQIRVELLIPELVIST